jgi:solute carrier family 36 (proton-coupled amino acid transporter)
MATSSRAVNVPIKRSPENLLDNPSPVGTPDLHALRAAYIGTPPVVPNIPPRGTGTSSPIPGRDAIRPDIPDPTPLDIDDLPEEEKIKALRKYLVSKTERQDPNAPTAPGVQTSASRNGASSPSSVKHVEREETEPFPIPYHAPGADVT